MANFKSIALTSFHINDILYKHFIIFLKSYNGSKLKEQQQKYNHGHQAYLFDSFNDIHELHVSLYHGQKEIIDNSPDCLPVMKKERMVFIIIDMLKERTNFKFFF